MLAFPTDLLNGFIAALFCGAFVGMERERGRAPRDASAPAYESGNVAGIRTHIMVALLGGVLSLLDPAEPRFALAGFLAIALYVGCAYGVRAARTGHYGMTSVPTLLLTYALGVLSFTPLRPVALAVAVVVTAVLAVKVPLHSFVRRLEPAELAAAVKFGLVSLVLLPLLPARDYGPNDWPWLAERLRAAGVEEEALGRLALVNPYELWLLVVVISGVGFAGYIAVRALGAGRGLVLTGLAGGLVSSTSTTLAMAQQSQKAKEWRYSLAAAVLAACAVMAVRVLVFAAALGRGLLPLLGPAIAAMLLVKVALAFAFARRDHEGQTAGKLPVTTPLALWPALKLAGLIFAVRVLSEVAVLWIGDAGLLVTAAVSGIVDVDALTIAAAQQSAAERVTPVFAASAIFLAVAVNTVAKGVMVLGTAERGMARTTFVALMAALLAGGAGLGVTLLLR